MPHIVNAELSQASHAQAVLELLDEYARGDMGGGCGLAPFVKQNLIEALKNRPGTHVLLAFAGHEAVGLAICFEGFSTFACKPLLNVHDLIVTAEHRGKGIAKQLLAKAETTALSLGCCKLTLEVLEGNRIAQAVYRACGFQAYQLDPAAGQAQFWQKPLSA